MIINLVDYYKIGNKLFPLCLIQHVEKSKERYLSLLERNSPILNHACRYLVPRTHNYQKFRLDIDLPSYMETPNSIKGYSFPLPYKL